MIIGCDLDGVVFNSEAMFSSKAELYDCRVLMRNSNIAENRTEPTVQKRYSWNGLELDRFIRDVLLCDDFDVMPCAKEVLDALREKGDIIYAVTARGQFSGVETDIAKKKLRQAGIKFDTVFWYQCDKLDIAKKLKLDVMIDDRIDICTAFAENGITALNFYMAGRKMPEESEKLRVVYNWGEVYRAIEQEREKKNKK